MDNGAIGVRKCGFRSTLISYALIVLLLHEFHFIPPTLLSVAAGIGFTFCPSVR